MGPFYFVLLLAFGIGVRMSSNPPLRIAGAFLIASAFLGLGWPFASMHMRGAEPTFADTMHLVLSAATMLLAFLMLWMGVLGASCFRRTDYGELNVPGPGR